MLYFAYGSNMNWAQMKKRCPSASFFGVAVLPDHRLAFTRKSVKLNCGVADAVREVGPKVWGVVYEVADMDLGGLDKSEGYRPGRDKNAYERRECMVFMDGDGYKPLTVHTYFASPEENPPFPSHGYKNTIVAGARYWHLPDDYIALLEAIEVAG